jgi:hypothetical protein
VGPGIAASVGAGLADGPPGAVRFAERDDREPKTIATPAANTRQSINAIPPNEAICHDFMPRIRLGMPEFLPEPSSENIKKLYHPVSAFSIEERVGWSK